MPLADISAETAGVFAEKGVSFSLAESCTGGMVSSALTSNPGVSSWFYGGVIAYSNSIKTDILSVPEGIIEKHGAVSEETAGAMARGCAGLFRSSVSGAVSGVAGPGGGTLEKPVGTVCFGICIRGSIHTAKELFSGTREEIRREASEYLLRQLKGLLRTI